LSDGTYSNCTIIVTDSAGNASSALSVSTFVVDTTAPSVSSFTLSDTALITGDNATVTLVFSEAVASFSSSADITVANGTLAVMTSTDNITWAGTFTPTANTEDDNNTLSLATSYTDTAGNTGPASTTANYAVETLAPSVNSVAISSASGVQNNFLNAGDNVSVTATFSENVPVTGTPQLTLVVGSVNQPAPYASGDNSTTLVFQYTIQSGDNDTNGISIGENALDLSGGTIRDPAGNNATLTHSSVDNNSSYMVDTTAPTVDNFTISDTKLLVGETMRVDLGFSEKVIEFIAADINLDNATGALPSMASSDNRTWSGTFTPTADSEDASNTLSLTTSSYTDPAGNAGPSAITSNYEVETLAPTASFSFTDYHLEPGETATVSLVFSEVVDNFSRVEDITVPDLDNGTTSGTLTAMTRLSDNRTWTGTFTPTFSNDNVTGTQDWTNTLSLDTGYTDTAGNTGTAATSPNYMVDEIDPYLKSFTLSDTELKAGETATVTLVFSEPVANLELADITADNGSLTNLDSNDNNTIWTVTFTPTDNIADLTNKLRLKSNSFTDIAGNYGTRPYAKWSFDNTTENFVVDTGGAAVTSFSPSNNKVCIPVSENITVTFNFPMYNSITTSTSDTYCAGNIIVSSASDNFCTGSDCCVRMSSEPVRSSANKTFTLDPVDNLAYDTTYKIKVTIAVESALRNNLSNQYESSFTTSPSPSSSVSGLFMAVGSGGKILRSTDNGSSWDIATSCQFSTNLYGITFGNNTFVAVGTSGNIVRSTDNGSSWDNVTTPTAKYLSGESDSETIPLWQ